MSVHKVNVAQPAPPELKAGLARKVISDPLVLVDLRESAVLVEPLALLVLKAL